jgi:2-amino-4-hydroxy-6-hydroxymethyldihydropteridine diphosphokinase
MIMKKVFLGIGTNLGNRESNIKEVVKKIEEHIGNVLQASSVYETTSWGFNAENDFLNMVLKVETVYSPFGLLKRALMIESMLGRVRNEEQYTSRIIDIDILLYEDQVIDIKNLKIPHPLLQERKFVLVPLCEIAPDMMHPVLKESFCALLDSCNDTNKVTKYK